MISAEHINKRPVRFLLNGSEISISPDHPDTTLLNWLRQSRHLTGSKEGCAEGDCGACSVIISSLSPEGDVEHHAANACILLLPMLDGMVITTIEHIAGPDGALHPVQDAMIEHHGSQCGFCTPGFVISLIAGWRQGMPWQRQNIEDLIAGNLCRCTGYGPIVAAAESLSDKTTPKWERERLDAEARWMTSHQTSSLNTAAERPFIAPDNIDDLSNTIMNNPAAQIIAGATDIGLWVTKKHQILPGFISVMRVPELNTITEDDDGYSLGCGVSHDHAMTKIGHAYPDLHELWRRFGSTQVRSSGTVCGNIANGSPIGDLPPSFLALGASLVIRHGQDERCLPLDQFYHDYMVNDLKDGEWVKSVYLPKIKSDQHVMIHKISRRFDQDISAVMGAFSYSTADGVITHAKIAYGGMAAIPKRASMIEDAIIGHQLNTSLPNAVLDLISEDFTPITDVRASADYRIHIARQLLARSVMTSENCRSLAGPGINSIQWEGAAE